MGSIVCAPTDLSPVIMFILNFWETKSIDGAGVIKLVGGVKLNKDNGWVLTILVTLLNGATKYHGGLLKN